MRQVADGDHGGGAATSTGAPGRLYVKGGWYLTRSPEAAAKEGCKARHLVESPLPPLGSDIAAGLRDRWSGLLIGPADVPPGWGTSPTPFSSGSQAATEEAGS